MALPPALVGFQGQANLLADEDLIDVLHTATLGVRLLVVRPSYSSRMLGTQ